MSSLAITLRHRPIRVGWCVERGDMNGLRHAFQSSFALWGGRYCPIIPVQDAVADSLVREFRVDVLYGAKGSQPVADFISRHKDRPWPFFADDILSNETGRHPQIADVTHPMLRFHREDLRNNPKDGLDIFQWSDDDPLSDVMLTTLGAFPNRDSSSIDYDDFAARLMNSERIEISPTDALPCLPKLGDRMTIALLNRHLLKRHYSVQSGWNYAGFFVGNCDKFDDLVRYWNLRAAGVPIVFYDPRHENRLAALRDDWALVASEHNRNERNDEDAIALWGDAAGIAGASDLFQGRVIQCAADDTLWNGYNLAAPLFYFNEVPALASVEERGGNQEITFAVTDTYFDQSLSRYEEHFVISVDTGFGLFRNDLETLNLPYLPALNEFYGRNVASMWNSARAEPASFGVIASITTPVISIRSVRATDLISEVLNVSGISAQISKSGFVAANLIRQMGGLNDCSIFKIRGVRRLIEEWRPDQSFNRACAKQTILGQGTERPLSSYTDLHIGVRSKDLSPDKVLNRLLERGVFRVGLELLCSNCRQWFWISLDHARARAECEYCGHHFNCGPQLKDKDWAFRRSGLFGRNDSQEGALPVALTLQHLRGIGAFDHTVFATAMDLKSDGADIEHCETDLVVLFHNRRRGIELAIGECKTRQAITDVDVLKLGKVANALRAGGIKTYLVFSKLASFDDEEIERIRPLNDIMHDPRVIMFTDQDLETWRPYQWAETLAPSRRHVSTLEDMAAATRDLYLTPPSAKGLSDILA